MNAYQLPRTTTISGADNMLHGLIDTLATIHYPAGLLVAAFAACLVSIPLTWKAAK